MMMPCALANAMKSLIASSPPVAKLFWACLGRLCIPCPEGEGSLVARIQQPKSSHTALAFQASSDLHTHQAWPSVLCEHWTHEVRLALRSSWESGHLDTGEEGF